MFQISFFLLFLFFFFTSDSSNETVESHERTLASLVVATSYMHVLKESKPLMLHMCLEFTI